MPSKPQSKLSAKSMDDLLPYGSESESRVITSFQRRSHLDMMRSQIARAISSVALDGESSETDSNESPYDAAKVEYEVSLYYYGDLIDETIRHDPTRIHWHVPKSNSTTTSRFRANPRKLTPKSSSSTKSTPTKISKNYKHKKNSLQIADPDKAITCSIAQVLRSKTGKRTKSIYQSRLFSD